MCKKVPEKWFTTKLSELSPSDFFMPTILSFKSIENKHDVYKRKDCMKKFCESLKEHEQQESNENANSVIFSKKKLKINM